jgi:hypothetical protein
MKISNLINHALPLGLRNNKPVLILGKSGIGKSDAVQQFAKNVGRNLIDLRLTLYDAVDLGGIPYIDPDTKELVRKVMKLLPTDESPPSVLLLDEINLALPSTQSSAYQLVLNDCLGEWEKPKNCYIVAAGNLTTDKGNTHTLAAPLRNRFTIIKLESDIDDWVDWALGNNIHPDIVGYVKFSPASLSTFDSNTNDNENFSTGRSLAVYSNYLYDKECPIDVVYEMGDGLIGSGTNVQFKNYRKTAGQLPDPKDILEGKVTVLNDKLKKEISCHWSLIISMVYFIKEAIINNTSDHTVIKYLENMIEFVDSNIDNKEFSIFALTMYMQAFTGTEYSNKSTKYIQSSEKLSKYVSFIVKYIK